MSLREKNKLPRIYLLKALRNKSLNESECVSQTNGTSFKEIKKLVLRDLLPKGLLK